MPKNGKPDPLLASLANLKPRLEPPERAQTAVLTPQTKKAERPAKEEPPFIDKLAPTFSVSIYESDFDRMEKVRRWLTSHGARSANKSELLRLGIRFAAQSEENAAKLAEIFLEMKAQDGRKKTG
jgi:hypothetical protein